MVDLPNLEHIAPDWVSNTSDNAAGDFAVHIFGAYREEYRDILEEIVDSLRNQGYPQTNTCEQLPDHTAAGMERPVQNWWESVYCMRTADAAIFLLLQPDDGRLKGKPKEGLNSSVIAELTFWTHFFARDTPSIAIVEGKMKEMGSLIPGLIDIYNVEKAHVGFDNIERMKNLSLMRCNDWVRQRPHS